MNPASRPYSAGSPRRGGLGTSLANSACTSSGSKFGRGPVVDRDCADDVMAQAAVQILKEREEMGLKTAPTFARLGTIETASYEQR